MNLGILGGGQLGRMLALSAYPLAVNSRFFEPAVESSAAEVGDRMQAEFDDFRALYAFASRLTAVTYEFENVPVESAEWLADRVPVWPPPQALAVAQDRIREKTFFADLGVPVPPFADVQTRADLDAAILRIGLPAVLKTTRFGYDGKGQRVLRTVAEVETAWTLLGGRPLILEQLIPFERELSILAVRGQNGDIVAYPLCENEHFEGMLRRTVFPAEASPTLQAEAEAIARAALERFHYVGLLAIELFEVNGRLFVNEMAPRVHNSGHATIEAAETSQFENHIRAVLGFPLGDPAPRGVSVMRNVIGTMPNVRELLRIPGVHVHDYGKSERANRKLGHVTIRADDRAMLTELERLAEGAFNK